MTDITLRCVKAPEGECFTTGEYYNVREVYYGDGTTEDRYYFLDDDGDRTVVYYPSDFSSDSTDFLMFELVEQPEKSYTSTEDEEELFGIIEEKQKQSVDCPVAIAHHIHELQKWLKHTGCDDEMELKITSDGLWVSPCAEELYGVKEGGVGTLIEYMRHMGGANKCLEKMEEL